jgi:membrane protein YdbS with pleckstrin-like domain
MAILINQGEGAEDLGPYGLNEVRELVRSKRVSLDDLAWVEGTPSWIPLRQVPGLLPIPPGSAPLKSSAAAVAAPTLSSAAAAPNTVTEEQDLWRGHPSQVLNFQVYALWVIVLCGTLAAGFVTKWAFYAVAGLAVIALIHCAICYIRLRSIEYAVTTQRVRVVSGLFSKNIEEIELFRVKDTSAHQPFFQRLFGLGTITILSGDEKMPHLVLNGIPRPIELRERLRHDVLNLRQRFGVREVDVM